MIEIPVAYHEDEVLLASLDAGAEDVTKGEETYEITMKGEDLIKVKEALEQIGVQEFLTAEVTYMPTNQVEVQEDAKEKIEGLIDALDELDDVSEVYHNLKL